MTAIYLDGVRHQSTYMSIYSNYGGGLAPDPQYTADFIYNGGTNFLFADLYVEY
ncbi:MAG: hypothetical protein MK193_10040 [Lentisphaeria bacterium]|nr:hypothetical protein [Lentisphaeria bacterium]